MKEITAQLWSGRLTPLGSKTSLMPALSRRQQRGPVSRPLFAHGAPSTRGPGSQPTRSSTAAVIAAEVKRTQSALTISGGLSSAIVVPFCLTSCSP